jgi:hypothetical protein
MEREWYGYLDKKNIYCTVGREKGGSQDEQTATFVRAPVEAIKIVVGTERAGMA